MHFFGLVLAGVAISSSVSYCFVPEFVKTVHAVRLHEPVRVDGILSESVWQQPGTTAFFQQEPNQGAPASEYTEVWVAYDDAALYIAARMKDDHPDSIIARLSRRDTDVGGDQFAVGVDSYHDHRNARYFCITAAGTLFDGILYNDDWSDVTWDGVWEAKQKITSDGWCVEMRIPFSQLRFEENEQYVWGIDFERIIGRKKEQSFLAYTPRNESGFVSRFPDLVGIEHISPPSRFEAMPFITGRAEYLKPSSGDPFNNGSKYAPDIGADFKLGLGSNLTVDGTINPDFGQVEVDPAVVNLSDVETYYDEKRPFFIEGMNIFSFGQGGVNNFWSFNWSSPSLFYSRRIGRAPERNLPDHDFSDIPSGVRILGAAKLTGKVIDGWNVGAIEAVTKRAYGQLDTGRTKWTLEVEPTTSFTIARIQHDYNDGKQGLGLLSTYTRRFFDDGQLRSDINQDAFIGGIDGWTALDNDKEYMVSGWGSYSLVHGSTDRMISLQQSSSHYYQRPDVSYLSLDSNATSLDGYAGRITLNKQKGRVMLNSSVGLISPGFESGDLGFVWRTDVINFHVAGGYKWTDPTPYYRNIYAYVSYFGTSDFGGTTQWRGVWTRLNYQFPDYQSLNFYYDYGFRSYNDRRTRGGPTMLNPPAREWGIEYYTDSRNNYIGETYWYAYEGADGFNHQLNLFLTLRPVSNLSLTIGPGFVHTLNKSQWIDNFSDPSASTTYSHRYIFSDLDYKEISAQIRVNWTLSPTLSFQLFAQPLFSSGKYNNFKEFSRSRTFDFMVFGTHGSTITPFLNSDGSIDSYDLDPDGNGPAPPMNISNPDFNLVSLRGNAVLRWEYMPGSTLYLVWTQSRSDNDGIGSFQFHRSLDRLSLAEPDNIFMLKLTYWIGG